MGLPFLFLLLQWAYCPIKNKSVCRLKFQTALLSKIISLPRKSDSFRDSFRRLNPSRYLHR
ncbi:hypothetical protein NEISUBOT_03124 [Neisseria subflava NJ9703]|uniref:Uncharacterized protein n=1 Tax=Neisseria subflava NJ9703 TaxID=546268 RepID=A0A9W5IST6_NEISU|nr:hypothetical protein NEISUBOT_03124 [Neisseria subflava NJ9703]